MGRRRTKTRTKTKRGSNRPKQRRHRAPVEPVGAWTRPRAAGRRAPTNGALGRHVRERIETLRLLRAVDAAVPDLAQVPGLDGEVEDLAEYDRLLRLGLHVWDLEGPPPDADELQVQLFEIGALIRAGIRALMPGALRSRVQAACAAADCGPEEVWADVRRLRAEGGPRARLQTIGIHTRLPSEAAVLESWLWCLDLAWLRTIARGHGVRSSGRKASLVTRVARPLCDVEALATCLRERSSDADRALLARLTAAGSAQCLLLTPEDEACLALAWDGRGAVPACAGARLRGLGLLYVGIREGYGAMVTQPLELQSRVAYLLLENHPEAIVALSQRKRDTLRIAADDFAASEVWP